MHASPVPERRRSRALAITLAVLTLVLTASALSAPSAVSQSAVPDPEYHSTTPTGWGWHTSATPATIGAFVNQGHRIVSLDLTSTSPTFSVAYVKNSGGYGRTWWWYYGLTGAQVAQRLSSNNARPTDLEPYATSNGIRYAVVMVRNTGAAAKTWAYYTSATLSTIGNYAGANNMRVVDVDRFVTGGNTRFSAILIRNAGVDARGWWHYYNVTASQIGSALTSNNARLIGLERISAGRYDVIMQSVAAGERWYWYYGVNSTQVADLTAQLGARIARIDSYVDAGVRRFNVLLLGNLDAESERIRSLVAGQLSGSWGYYLKRVGGGQVVGLNQDTVFEPASMIKIVHAVHALRDVQNPNTTTSLTTNVTWYADPSNSARYPGDSDYDDDKNKCAYNSSGTLLTGNTYSDRLGSVIIKNMLEQSDNRTTDAITRRYGFTALNQTIADAGMTRSRLNHRIGCPSASSPQPWTNNRLTLADAGRIYERVQNGTLLDATRRTALYGYLLGGPIGSGNLRDMVVAEAQSAGLTPTEVNQFVDRVATRSKGGSYGLCPTSGACDPPTLQHRTVGGIIWVPFKNSGGTPVDTPFVYGRYFNTQFNCSFASVRAGSCTSFNNASTAMGTVAVEMFRKTVRDALATW